MMTHSPGVEVQRLADMLNRYSAAWGNRHTDIADDFGKAATALTALAADRDAWIKRMNQQGAAYAEQIVALTAENERFKNNAREEIVRLNHEIATLKSRLEAAERQNGEMQEKIEGWAVWAANLGCSVLAAEIRRAQAAIQEKKE